VDNANQQRLEITKSFSVANCLITQNRWRAMFKAIRQYPELTGKLDLVFKEQSPEKRASLINELKGLDSERKTGLANPAGNALNAMLFCYDPHYFTSVVSLKQ